LLKFSTNDLFVHHFNFNQVVPGQHITIIYQCFGIGAALIKLKINQEECRLLLSQSEKSTSFVVGPSPLPMIAHEPHLSSTMQLKTSRFANLFKIWFITYQNYIMQAKKCIQNQITQ
jgi:hypothetical protein